MPNLRFLKVYKSRDDGNDSMHIPEEMEFPCRLRLLDWEAYPSKSLPPTFNPQYLVELNMHESQLEYLWQGTQPLTNLKKITLSTSPHLKELPDLSNATNLETLNLISCDSLVEIPSSVSLLHKLKNLTTGGCINLEVIPAHMNLASLEFVFLQGCSRLRNIPVMSTNIKELIISETGVEGVPPSIRLCSRLESLSISSSGKGLTHFPPSLTQLDLSDSDFKMIPNCIKDLHQLQYLHISCCRRLTSLPELPPPLRFLIADDCESLETMTYPLIAMFAFLNFTNCFKLSQQARRAIIQQKSFGHFSSCFPGSEMPAEFDHRSRGNSLTILLDSNRYYNGFEFCLVISPKPTTEYHRAIGPWNMLLDSASHDRKSLSWCRIIDQDDGYPVKGLVSVGNVYKCRTEHLFIFHYRFLPKSYQPEVSRETMFEFSSKFHEFDISECGAKIWTQESYESDPSF